MGELSDVLGVVKEGTSIVSDYYVLLRRELQNSGDFLIRSRAERLLASQRPDIRLVSMDGQSRLTDEQVEVVNASRALLLVGGPSIHPQIYPKIYPLRENLDDIEVPITTFGSGWMSRHGSWQEASRFRFSRRSKKLMDRIASSGFVSSVRDYHSQMALRRNGYSNFVVTGCPVLFAGRERSRQISGPITLGFSPGRSIFDSSAALNQTKKVMARLADGFGDGSIHLIFHHSLNEQVLKDAYSNSSRKFASQVEVAEHGRNLGFKVVDISGSAATMEDAYEDVDVHVGFRVHAHLLSISESKPSILLIEDGRGAGAATVLGGSTVSARVSPRWAVPEVFAKVQDRLPFADSYSPLGNLDQVVVDLAKDEVESGFQMSRGAYANRDTLAPVMESFLKQLP